MTATGGALRRAGELAGSLALVTGGGRGLGRVLARALAGAGAAVGLVARSSDELAQSVALIEEAGGITAAATADVSDARAAAAAVAAVVAELGPIDLLVNNAGVCGPVGPAWEVDADEWWRTIEVNLRSTFLCSRLVLPGMVARRRGSRASPQLSRHPSPRCRRSPTRPRRRFQRS